MTPTAGAPPLLEARDLGKSYAVARGWLREPVRRPAFAGVDLTLEPGRIVGLVGASGAGKSTLGRCLSLLERPDSGSLLYRGREVGAASDRTLRAFRSDVQLVFQDAASSFNPRWSARRMLEEPLLLAGRSRPDRRARLEELAELVGLRATDLDRRARDFSGGQLRRLNLARALSIEPSVLILDEPFTGLDLSLQAQVANLLTTIQRRRGPACLHISHDLAMVSHLADEVIVLDAGRIVERGDIDEVLSHPAAPPTRRLIAAGLAPPT